MMTVSSLKSVHTAKRAGEIVSLQYIRALAALGVVFYHAEIQVNDVFAKGDYHLALTGRFGVDLFFILSGYVMWLSAGKKDITPRRFMAKRLARIVPLYWLVTIIAAVVAILTPTLLRSTVFDVPTLITSILFIPWPNPAAAVAGGETLVRALARTGGCEPAGEGQRR